MSDAITKNLCGRGAKQACIGRLAIRASPPPATGRSVNLNLTSKFILGSENVFPTLDGKNCPKPVATDAATPRSTIRFETLRTQTAPPMTKARSRCADKAVPEVVDFDKR
jgi:hypothetical protein